MTDYMLPPPSKLAAALVAAQAEFTAVRKAGTGNYGSYAKFDDLVDDTRPILHRHGLAITQWPSFDEQGRPTLVNYLVHESGEMMTHSMLLLLGKTDPAGQGSGITYARRYSWQAILGIAAEADDDGQAAQPAPKKTKPQMAEGDPPKVDTSAAIKRVETLYSDLDVHAKDRKAQSAEILKIDALPEFEGTPSHKALNMRQLNLIISALGHRLQAQRDLENAQ